MKFSTIILALLIPHVGFAQDAGANARAALYELVEASIKLDKADSARDRVKALTGTMVNAPTVATIRYVGPLLDYGNVMILEPQTDTLFVFAGFDITFGKMGQVISEGTPLGLMGG